MRLTAEDLGAALACEAQRSKFHRLYPTGIEIDAEGYDKARADGWERDSFVWLWTHWLVKFLPEGFPKHDYSRASAECLGCEFQEWVYSTEETLKRAIVAVGAQTAWTTLRAENPKLDSCISKIERALEARSAGDVR